MPVCHPGGDASQPGTREGTLRLGRLLAGGAWNRPTDALSRGRAGERRGELAGTRGVTPDPPPPRPSSRLCWKMGVGLVAFGDGHQHLLG